MVRTVNLHTPETRVVHRMLPVPQQYTVLLTCMQLYCLEL